MSAERFGTGLKGSSDQHECGAKIGSQSCGNGCRLGGGKTRMKARGPNVPQWMCGDDGTAAKPNGGEPCQVQQAAPRQGIVHALDRKVRDTGPVVRRKVDWCCRIQSESRQIETEPPVENAVVCEVAVVAHAVMARRLAGGSMICWLRPKRQASENVRASERLE